ncbi:MAG: restriction endonuclease [Saprospiraceae bacterium]|nr:restriction endonuclease [Saprospiraceae bacterium]
MNKHEPIVVFEHESIHVDRRNNKLTADQLKALQTFYGDKGVPYYSLIHNGVRFCEYVGVIQVGNMVIEVLPKADKSSDDATKTKWKKLLIDMLRAVGLFDIHAPSSTSLKLKSNSILDLYFELYLKELEYLLHRGLVKRYRKTEGNTTALKGSLQFSKHIQQNLVHQERFYVRYTTYDTQHTIHSILYKALKLLKQINTKSTLHSRIGALMLNFPEMTDIKVTEATFEKITYNRKDEHYQKALEIARLILLNYHPDVSSGRNHVLALMFDMNLLWEQFVYASIRKQLKKHHPNYTITSQVPKYFWKPKNGYSSRMIPDIVINKDSEKGDCIVLDTKWKNLNGYNPSPEDLRQMYVYHEYFGAKKVALIYPCTEGESKITSGSYFIANSKDNQESDKECSVISVATKPNIKDWQDNIFEEINKWTK